MNNLVGDPVLRARSDVSRGDVHLFSRFEYGNSAGPETPGVYNCPGWKKIVDDKNENLVPTGTVKWVEMPIDIDDSKTRQRATREADYLVALTPCGQRQDKYMHDYNIEVVNLQPPNIRLACKGASVDQQGVGR